MFTSQLCMFPFIRFSFRHARKLLDASLLLESIDQPARTGIMACVLPTLIKLRLYLLCQGFAQFYTPLVEAVNVPHGSFGKCEVLVVCYQRSKRAWCNLLGEDRCCRSVAEERLVGNQLLGGSFGFDFVWCLPNHQGFGLSEEVRSQHPIDMSAQYAKSSDSEKPTSGACCAQWDYGSQRRG